MGKFRYFELSEFINSDTAKKRMIDNCPTFEVVDHLCELVENFLDPLRAALGKPIDVSSGYRCRKLNTAVGGVLSSAHLTGYAADITCAYLSFTKFKDFVVDWVKKTNRKFDQIIVETDKKTGVQWVHVAIYNSKRQQRGQILNIDK